MSCFPRLYTNTLAALALLLSLGRVVAQNSEPFTVSDDGSVRCTVAAKLLRFKFGFETMPAARVWFEGAALRREWNTNGIRYTQTLLITDLPASSGQNPRQVLLVNVRGENTNSEYAQAHADLAVEMDDKARELELKDSLVWCRLPEGRKVLAALEIPAPGVRETKGLVLHFQGNMPPSERGSFTLKVPLQEIQPTEAAERLAEIDFVEASAKAVKKP